MEAMEASVTAPHRQNKNRSAKGVVLYRESVISCACWYKPARLRPSLKPSNPPRAGAGAAPRNALGLTDYPQVDMLGVRYKSVNFGARTSPGAPKWRSEITWDRARTGAGFYNISGFAV
jgi:hypothetical protein